MLKYRLKCHIAPSKAREKLIFKVFIPKLRGTPKKIEKIKKGDLVIILTTQHTVYIAELFKKSLEKIGVNTEIIFDSHASEYSDSWHIVICPNMFTHLPRFYYAYQMEQSVSSKWFTKGYFNRLFRAKAVFDYSIANIAYLQRNGVPFQKLFYMPVGLLGSDIVQPDSSYTYDVLFYGDVNCPRRRLFLDKLKSKFKVTKLLWSDYLLHKSCSINI